MATLRAGKVIRRDPSEKLTPLAKEFLDSHPEVIVQTSINPVRELRPLTACTDGGIKLPSAWKSVHHRLKSVVFSNGIKMSEERRISIEKESKSTNRTPLLAGNWKMYKTISESVALVNELKKSCAGIGDREILVCPPAISLAVVNEIVKGTNVFLGAQNLHWEQQGAFTGEVSGPMLKEAGCQYVIVGHSERRQYFGETDESVNKKMKAAFRFGLIPIVCVGETLQEREDNSAFKVVERQIKIGIAGLSPQEMTKLVIAYEPVWAIGTGKTATPQQAQEMHAFIRKLIAEMYGKESAEKIRILYGGSIKPDNIDSLMAQTDIDGGLVGGASLKAEDFTRIVKYQ